MFQDAYNQPTAEKLGVLIDYLNSLSGRPLTLSCVRQNVLKYKWSSRETGLRNRCHLKAAALYLDFLGSSSNDELAQGIRTTIADLAPYIRYFDKNADLDFIVLSTNTLPSAIHFFQAKELFYKNNLHSSANDRYGLDLLILYALRLAIEKRVFGFLGVDFIESKKGPVSLSKVIEVIKKLTHPKYKKELNWEELEWVVDWLNHHMHRHLRPYPWVIHQGFEVAGQLLAPTVTQTKTRFQASLYGSTMISDIAAHKNEVELLITELIPQARIFWGEFEVLKVNGTD